MSQSGVPKAIIPPTRDRGASQDARSRILGAAYDLFCRHGIHAVGVDRIISEARVAKLTLYRHFASKEELALAVLKRRDELWTAGWLELECERRARTPAGQLLAVFDAFDEWLRLEDFEGCLFTNSLLESHDRRSPVAARSIEELGNFRALIRRFAAAAEVRDPDELARQWQILMWGVIVAGAAGDVDAARRTREVAVLILEREKVAP